MLTFDEQLARNFNQQRLVATLTSLYGQLALLLAAIGLYGITAHNVARRTGEIGLRMALGADRRRVLTMVLRRALIQTAIGLAIGLPIALFAGRGLSSQLYGITPRDPLVVGTAIGVLLVAALIAGVLPARGRRRSIRSGPSKQSRHQAQGERQRGTGECTRQCQGRMPGA